MSLDTPENTLQFASVSSFVQSSFWNKLAELKINVDRLEEKEHKIWGYFSNSSSLWNTHILEVDSTSFNDLFEAELHKIPFHGTLYNKNTIEKFKECDKKAFITENGRRFLDNIENGACIEDPSKINFFTLLTFSDLKKYHFYYWFAFPVPHNMHLDFVENIPINAQYSEVKLKTLTDNFIALETPQKSYFLIKNSEIFTLESKLKKIDSSNYNEYSFAFADCEFTKNHPRSQLKNYTLFLLHYCPFLAEKTVSFVLFSMVKNTCEKSSILRVKLPVIDVLEYYRNQSNAWVGWEKNENGKLLPRFSNMKNSMDPERLYKESVDLNLKLIKWRLVPDLNLQIIKENKVLLLGSGTLGCSVARALIGWGVENITFVDNSTVSYTNPVRQSLFTYQDALKSKPKSQAAVDNIKLIVPSINAVGHQLTIPMPGHSVGENTLEEVKKSVEMLEKLIVEHDTIFLLTDSRESRWLPTLLGTIHSKMIINCALGFDTYLIMRYGAKSVTDATEIVTPKGYKAIPGDQLGCYFCNDVTAPGNSLKDRTLDQQCTVTRPGLSQIAGALAVELAISVLQHPEQNRATALYKIHDSPSTSTSNPSLGASDGNSSILGVLPHSIRGFLAHFEHVLPATPRYTHCIACSTRILGAFRERGFAFLLEAFNSSKHLEDVAGLSELHADSNYIDVLELSDDEGWE